MIHTALNLLTVALEVGIDHVNHFPSLIKLIRNQLCRNLLLIIKPETKLHIFMASLRVCLLLFESLRTQLKFQLEMFITKLTNIVTSESSGVSYYYKELALEAIVQLWRMPSFITELFLNFDCNLYSSNVFEDLTKILAKNSFPFQGLFSTNVLSLEALLTAIDIIGTHNLTVQQESQTSDKLDSKHEQLDSYKLDYKSNYIVGLGLLYGCIPLQPHFRARLSITGAEEISREYLLAVKEKKKLLRHGSEIFNTKPEKGIQFLQDNSILGKTYEDIALFLRDNPHLDKKVIGEFVSKKKNVAVLSAFVKSFNFKSLRIDECLRMFLESFRLPGEAPLISIIIEHFSSHWHLSNGEPFEKEDAAFTLAYAVIMLNVDQHNQNAKKQNIPMTLNQFTNNLRGVNNGKDFDRKMLEEIYNAIHNEEIVMPAEQSGLVKENYLWKLLLKRGNSKEGKYFVARIDDYKFDKDLFALCWGPSIASLSFVFDKCTDESLVKKAVAGFEKCATISARYGMTDVFDNLIISLCKFTMLTSSSESPDQISISFGFNPKAQLSATTVFSLVILHGDMLREAWRNVIELLLQFFKLRLLPIPMIESEDFVHPSGKVSLISVSPSNIPRTESGIFSSLYSYIALGDSGSSKGLSEEDLEAMERAKTCVLKCHPEKIITESAFLRYDSLCELLKTVMSAGDTNFMIDQNPISPTVKSLSPKNQESTHTALDEYGQAFLLELVVSILVANKDRAGGVWPSIRDHIYSLLMSAVALNKHFLLERCIVAVLKVAKVLLRRPELANPILQSLRMLLLLRSHVLNKAAVQVVSGIYEVLSVNADHILDSNDWAILFALLECCGAGAKPPPIVNVDRSYVDDFSQRSAASDSETAGSLVDSGNSTDTSNTLTEKEDHGVSSKFDDENKVFDQATLPELFSGQFGPFSSRPSRSTSPETIQNAGGWILVGKEGEIEPVPVKPISFNQYDIVHQRILEQHNPEALLKSVETVSFLVRERHITSSSLPSVVQACRTLVEATLNGGKSEKRLKSRESSRPPSERRTHATRRKDDRSNVSAKKAVPRNAGAAHFEYDADESDADDSPISYHRMSEKILDLMDSLHSNSSHILNMSSDEGVCRQPPLGHFVSLWNQALCPLLQGMARYCCDSRNTIRNLAMTYLQRALLNHDLQSLSATEWEGCFNKVLFPLLSKLLLPIDEGNHNAMEETRVRAATLVQKVYLRHLTSLMCLPTFTALWLTILDFMDKYLNTHRSDHLNDAIPEILKNMLLVMETTQVFHTSEGFTHLWSVTWDRIDSFLPAFRNELFKSHPPSEIHRVDLQVSSTALNHQSDNTSSRTVVLSKATGGATAELDLQMGDTHQLEDYSAASSFEESGDNVHNYSSALSSDYKEKSLSQEAADNNKTYSLSGQNAIRLSLSQEDLASCISSNIILGPPLPYVTPIPSDSSSVAGQNSASSCPNVSISSCDHVKPTVCASPPLASILFKKSNPGDPFDSMVNPSAPVKVEASDCDSVTVKIFKEN